MQTQLPRFFEALIQSGYLAKTDILHTGDGFYAVTRSVASLLAGQNIPTYQNSQGKMRLWDRFYDDWYLYAVPMGNDYVYSLFKMREQEADALSGIPADADTPGVTISFIAFEADTLTACLKNPTDANRTALEAELNRVVARQKQAHNEAIKAYFIRPQSKGAYLIAESYVSFLASLSPNGKLSVPSHYADLYVRSKGLHPTHKKARIPQFIDSNNTHAGYTVCDHKTIYIRNPQALSLPEKLALLATHTANISFHSFAAEVRYHAKFLTPLARIPIPVIGKSVYASAIRADMTIDDTELEGPAPFYDLSSPWVQEQKQYHPEY